MWDLGEAKLRQAMDALGLPYVEVVGEAAFYGPKVDVQIRDVLGREETLSTIQLDFHLPERFELTYIGEDGREHQPVMIHRGVISTMERITAYLIELYGGAFPLWLAPVQAVVIPIADRHVEYAVAVAERLKAGRSARRGRRPQRAHERQDPRCAAPEGALHARRRRQRDRRRDGERPPAQRREPRRRACRGGRRADAAGGRPRA